MNLIFKKKKKKAPCRVQLVLQLLSLTHWFSSCCHSHIGSESSTAKCEVCAWWADPIKMNKKTEYETKYLAFE
jgi:hypothetical protein